MLSLDPLLFSGPDGLKLCPANREDLSLILSFIRELAEYEGLAHQVTATEKLLEHWLFERPVAYCLIARLPGTSAPAGPSFPAASGNPGDPSLPWIPVGFCLFFYSFSTFQGKAGLYLEDLFVRPAYRGRGYGSFILQYLAGLTLAEEGGRLEWSCLDWNKPSLTFYHNLKARPLPEWIRLRLEGKDLKDLAVFSNSFPGVSG